MGGVLRGEGDHLVDAVDLFIVCCRDFFDARRGFVDDGGDFLEGLDGVVDVRICTSDSLVGLLSGGNGSGGLILDRLDAGCDLMRVFFRLFGE